MKQQCRFSRCSRSGDKSRARQWNHGGYEAVLLLKYVGSFRSLGLHLVSIANWNAGGRHVRAYSAVWNSIISLSRTFDKKNRGNRGTCGHK